MGKRTWTDHQKETLKHLHGKVSNREIAEKIGKTTKQVTWMARMLCRDSIRRWRKKEEYFDRILSLHQEGHSTIQIAKMLSMNFDVVRRWLKQHNLKPNGANRESKLQQKRTMRINRIQKNVKLVWHCLLQQYPRRDEDRRVRRFGPFKDMVQQCTLHLFEKCHNYNPRKGKLSTWIYNSLRHYTKRLLYSSGMVRIPEYLQVGKKKKEVKRIGVQSISDKESLVVGSDGRDVFQNEETREILLEVMSQLSSQEKEILMQFYFENKQDDEIASAMSREMRSVRYQRQQILKKLRSCLEDKHGLSSWDIIGQ